MKRRTILRCGAHPQRAAGPILEARLRNVVIGELCEVRRHWLDETSVAKAQVIGFRADTVLLSLLGEARGLSRESILLPTGGGAQLNCSAQLLGTVIDASGQVVERLSEPASGRESVLLPLDADPPPYFQRRSVREPLITGIRTIDGVLTCGVGQRVGIFASAGSGKTSLMNMLIEHCQADVFVIGLIGERGREVTEFVEALRLSPKRSRCIVVYATSDQASVDRCNAALLATTVAEYFRDQGGRVVLFQDSMTRYARARRDLALAAGEAPARRGYPASVFDCLPRLLERPGVTESGSITAFCTVLLESDDEPDPIAEEIRSILDGHIYLSRTLAEKGQYPAIDLLRSASRVAAQVTDTDHQRLAAKLREMLGRLDDLQILIDLGEYKPGLDAKNDFVMDRSEAIREWLSQPMAEECAWSETLDSLQRLVS
ncbi:MULTISPECIES: type III secretion system ATPase SctN [Pseudomonas]|uniref:type III secretion system ATPase SctN n=1 Tax=Pseudomonas TaxID=286 RepID=UPI000F576B06|nr:MULTISPECIES: type III secretion system ATPase SctN [Pseudomonas]AZF15579.1 Type III secretion cytoplasmic ATP synthase (YscN,SpaL,MxiB,HrcN,EscN) [Pseudomonas sp. R3-18-08]AZF26225.1 Type III secretion cytoplasmic ATP synthase (YscN,SpaL,MxiB,HrcN,EscN) [Pseudomonas sp. R2-60-08W]AZF31590.1 Type III secretion cytoplasmic ATP synthase (YscN,SpaL,MxiB,HrcN,EscN) [Pseudomonas sp. R4-35-07]AZF36865.1 Type III secretion cytoplasmic ATP synthase (YscN,SpaL,MxiB,HrcN,EscN) [Pseudomonas sp. R4-39-0